MAHIVIIGAGLGGMTMAYDMRHHARQEDKITVVSNNPKFHFVPSNPWVAVSWRKREEIELDAATYLNRRNIDFIGVGVKRVHPDENRLELDDGQLINYDYLIISTGPKLAFDEVEGLSSTRWPYPIHLPRRSRRIIRTGMARFRAKPRPDRSRCGSGRIVLRPCV